MTVHLEDLLNRIETDRGPARALRTRGAFKQQRILLPEAQDERILQAAAAMRQADLAQPLLVGRPRPGRIDPALARILDPECWLDPTADDLRQRTVELILGKRRHRGMTQGQAFVLASEPLWQASALLALDKADAVVAGAATTTAEVVRAALWCVGPDKAGGTVSGAFLMLPPDADFRPLIVADCAVVPVPTLEQRLQIAEATSRSWLNLYGRPPAVAFLSFSTRGSSSHPAVAEIGLAAREFALRHPDWQVAGEIQVDAALMPEVAAGKGIDWGESGAADVLLFPDLNSGNIGSKLVERLGRWRAVGPFLQGLRRPFSDLSRGCSALDVIDAALLAARLAADSVGRRGDRTPRR